MNEAAQKTKRLIEKTLGSHAAFRRVDDDFFLVHQGSAYIYLLVVDWGPDRAVVRCIAQLAQGVDITPDLSIRLLKLNAKLRFGAFGFVRERACVTFSHTLVAGASLKADDLLSILREISVLADEFDDEIVAEVGGQTMQQLIDEQNLLTVRESFLVQEHGPSRSEIQSKNRGDK
jgi:hypothetical protein